MCIGTRDTTDTIGGCVDTMYSNNAALIDINVKKPQFIR